MPLIEGEHIRAADLAAAVPAFATLDPELEVGLSPLPGVKRVFHPADLLRLARENGSQCLRLRLKYASSERRRRLANRPRIRRSLRWPSSAATRSRSASAGGVMLTFEAEAESSGRPGRYRDHPQSGKRQPLRRPS